MGGAGSGSWQQRATVTVEDAPHISIRHISKEGAARGLSPYPLTTTRCNYGGVRYWFVCPQCSRRAAKLYGHAQKRCRRCARLLYPSQLESQSDRLLRRADRIRSRYLKRSEFSDLFQCDDIHPNGRPKRMHTDTWIRLEEAADWFEHAALEAAYGIVTDALAEARRLGRRWGSR